MLCYLNILYLHPDEQGGFYQQRAQQNQANDGNNRNPFQGGGFNSNNNNNNNNRNVPRFNRNPNQNNQNCQPRPWGWSQDRGNTNSYPQRFGGPPNFQNSQRFQSGGGQERPAFNQQMHNGPSNQQMCSQNDMARQGVHEKQRYPGPSSFVTNSQSQFTQFNPSNFGQGGFSVASSLDFSRPPPSLLSNSPAAGMGDSVRQPIHNMTFSPGHGAIRPGMGQQTFPNGSVPGSPSNMRGPSQQGNVHMSGQGVQFPMTNTGQGLMCNAQSNVPFAGQMMFQNQYNGAANNQGQGNMMSQSQGLFNGQGGIAGQGFVNNPVGIPSQVQGQVGVHGQVQGHMNSQGQRRLSGHGQGVPVHGLPTVPQHGLPTVPQHGLQSQSLQQQTGVNNGFPGMNNNRFASPLVDNRLIQNSHN